MHQTAPRPTEGGRRLRLVRAVVVLLVLLVGCSYVADHVARNELQAIRDVIDADLDVGDVRISPLAGRVEIEALTLSRQGKPFFRCQHIEVPLHLSLRRGTLEFGRATFVSPSLEVRRLEDGNLNVDDLFRLRPEAGPPPVLPPVLVTNGRVVLRERGFPADLVFSDVQIDMVPRGSSFDVDILGTAAWSGQAPLCRHFGIRGSLRSFDDLTLKLLLRDLDTARVPNRWLDGGVLEGMVQAKCTVERLGGTTAATGTIETTETSVAPGTTSHFYKTWFRDFVGTFGLQHGSSPLQVEPALPTGGGLSVALSTDRGEIRLQLPDKRKVLTLATPAFQLAYDGSTVELTKLHGHMLGSALTARLTVELQDVPTLQTHFSLTGLDAKQLANLMPLPNFSLAGTIDVGGTVRGTFERPLLMARLSSPQLKLFVGTSSSNIIALADGLQTNVRYDGRLITVDGLRCRLASDTEVTVNGHYEPESGRNLSLEVVLERLSGDLVDSLLGRPGLFDSLPLRPLGSFGVTARLYSDEAAPRVALTLRAANSPVRLLDTLLPSNVLTIASAAALPDWRLPPVLTASARLELVQGGLVETRGTVPLITTAPLNLQATARAVDLGLLASFAPLPHVTGTGTVDLDVTIEGRDGGTTHVVDGTVRLPGNGTLTVPYERDGEVHPLTVKVSALKAKASLRRGPSSTTLGISDFVTGLQDGGRLSLSVDHVQSTTGSRASAGFKAAGIDASSLLRLLDVSFCAAKGVGDVAGSYTADGDDRTVVIRLDFPNSTIEHTDEGTTYRLPVTNLRGTCRYEQTTGTSRFVVPELDAELMQGTLTISGTNELTPVVKPNLRFVLDAIEVKDLCNGLGLVDFSARGRARVDGLLSGNIWWPRVTATVTGPTFGLYWQVDEEARYPLTVGSTTGHLDLRREKRGFVLDVADLATTAIEGSLAGSGTVRLTPAVELDLNLSLARGTAKQLATLLGIDDFSFAGTLNATAALRGPGRRPTLTADLRLDDARLFYRLRGFNLFYQPPFVTGRLTLDKEHLELSDVRGPIHGGSFKFRIHRQRRQDVLWNAQLSFVDVDLHRLFAANLHQKNDIRGRGQLDLFFQGKGSDQRSFAGRGDVRVDGGAIVELEELERIQKNYDLRHLVGVTFERLGAKLKLLGERLTFDEANVRSSKGHAKGELCVGFDKSLDGRFRVGLDRDVLAPGHRLVSLLEGGRYFDFDARVGGTTDDPDFKFSAKGVQRGALLGGALLFSPIAPAAAIIGGLKSLFGGHRRHRPAEPTAATTAP